MNDYKKQKEKIMKNGRKKKEKKFGGRKQIYKKEETQTCIKKINLKKERRF